MCMFILYTHNMYVYVYMNTYIYIYAVGPKPSVQSCTSSYRGWVGGWGDNNVRYDTHHVSLSSPSLTSWPQRVHVDRRAWKHVYLWMCCLFLFSAARTFEHAKGLATTLQRDRLRQYMFEDHSAATFRVRKALVLESEQGPCCDYLFAHVCECF